jgi:hypothetical protein
VLNILLAAAVAAASPAPQAGSPDPAPAAAPGKPAKAAEKPTDVVCWVEEATGSHYPQRYCSTRGQLELRERTDKAALNNRGRRPTGGLFGPQ